VVKNDEENRIRELINKKTFPDKWDGDEIGGEVMIDTIYSDGTMWPLLFGN
jgi:DNA sulfur modification protein DndC